MQSRMISPDKLLHFLNASIRQVCIGMRSLHSNILAAPVSPAGLAKSSRRAGGKRLRSSVPPTTSKGRGRPGGRSADTAKRSPPMLRNDDATAQLRLMDRIFLAIIASALLLLFGASGMIVTRTADALHHARTVGVAGSR